MEAKEYKNNIKYLIDFINEHQFDNFNHIYLYIHPTIDKVSESVRGVANFTKIIVRFYFIV